MAHLFEQGFSFDTNAQKADVNSSQNINNAEELHLHLINESYSPNASSKSNALPRFGPLDWEHASRIEKSNTINPFNDPREIGDGSDCGFGLNAKQIEVSIANGAEVLSFDQRQPGDILVAHEPGEDWKAECGKSRVGFVLSDTDFVKLYDPGTLHSPVVRADEILPGGEMFVVRPAPY